jgi:hypothetical protein
MTYLKKMYGPKSTAAPVNNKNPNRVAGGLRAQGVDSFSMLGEDGSERIVASKKYVDALERKINHQNTTINTLTKKVKTHEGIIDNVLRTVNNIRFNRGE